MVKYTDLQILAESRLKEAKVLYRNKLYDGAAYLCGYVIELSLKARICKHLGLQEYPDDGNYKTIFSSHDYDRLLLLAGLKDQITITNPTLFTNYSILTKWKPENRYMTIGTYNQQDVKEMLDALNKGKWGVYRWIKTLW